jgi:hypothetical protein
MRKATPCLMAALIGAGTLMQANLCSAQSAAQSPGIAPPAERRDGQHDFDFAIGVWKTHISRRLHPLTGSNEWADYDGTSNVRKVWSGRASLGETEADGPAGHIQALSWRLYNPESHQWALSYASTGGTTSIASALSPPTVGEFHGGRGEFFDTEAYNGRNILVRNTWSDITPTSIRFEQAFSEDGGRTWETNWIAVDTRVDIAPLAEKLTPIDPAKPASDGQHDFDFEVGAWKTHLKLLTHPLSKSSSWVEFDGTSVIRPVWGGRANMVELEASGSAGTIEGASLRLFNAQTHQWSLNFSNSKSGTLGPPTIGEFKKGRGEFYDQEDLGGRMIFVRFVIYDISATSVRFEQSYSADGGKTWEVNWIATDTRLPDADTAANH